MAEGAPLLREYVGKTCIQGSNPCDSASEMFAKVRIGPVKAPQTQCLRGFLVCVDRAAALSRRVERRKAFVGFTGVVLPSLGWCPHRQQSSSPWPTPAGSPCMRVSRRRCSSKAVLPVRRPRRMLRVPHFPLHSMSTTTTAKTTAFMKALKPSAALAVIVGSDPLPRTEVTKRIWDYIKTHNLQNPANKRNILCDAPLRAVMGKDEVTMFEMTGLVGKHLGPN